LAKRVLITGGAGFIGSHVCEAFLERGWNAEVLDNLSTGKRDRVPTGARFHELDVRSAEAGQVVRSGTFDVVVHLAAQIDVRKSVEDPVYDAGVNILGTLNLLEALRASGRGSSTRFVFTSTGGALYGNFITPPNVEDMPKDPESPYAISKLSVEYYLGYYARVHGFDPVSVRFGNVYGPRQDPHGEAGVVAIFSGRILNGKALSIFGDGSQTRDYVYVGDVAGAVFRAATATLPKPGRLDDRGFNIGTGVSTSVTDLARELVATAGREVPIEHLPPRPGELQDSQLDVSKTTKVLGWSSSFDLRAGLRETFKWFHAQHGAAAPKARA
jgi:UDP-glucose 4-epimerase